jgi:hypothetical protein
VDFLSTRGATGAVQSEVQRRGYTRAASSDERACLGRAVDLEAELAKAGLWNGWRRTSANRDSAGDAAYPGYLSAEDEVMVKDDRVWYSRAAAVGITLFPGGSRLARIGAGAKG